MRSPEEAIERVRILEEALESLESTVESLRAAKQRFYGETRTRDHVDVAEELDAIWNAKRAVVHAAQALAETAAQTRFFAQS